MNFNIYLIYADNLHKIKKDTSYNPEHRDIIWEICRIINKTGDVDLFIEGFPEEEVQYNWNDKLSRFNLTTDWDLAMVMEQMPYVLKNILNNNFNFNIYFYEQGSEFVLYFKEFNDSYVQVRYESSNTLAPENSKILADNTSHRSCIICASSETLVEKTKLREMMIKLYKDFIFIAKSICDYLLEIEDKSIKEFLQIQDII